MSPAFNKPNARIDFSKLSGGSCPKQLYWLAEVSDKRRVRNPTVREGAPETNTRITRNHPS